MNSKIALERLKQIIGEEKYIEVIRELAGATVYFPENYEWNDKTLRDMQIKEDFYSGKYEITDLARKYDLSISRIYKIIQKKA